MDGLVKYNEFFIEKLKLTKRNFDLYPLWCEYYEADEYEEILSWGIEKEWLDTQLLAFLSEEAHIHPYYSLPLKKEFFSREFVYAKIQIKLGKLLEGYLCITCGEISNVNIFMNNSIITFYRNVDCSKENFSELAKMSKLLNIGLEKLYPIPFTLDDRIRSLKLEIDNWKFPLP